MSMQKMLCTLGKFDIPIIQLQPSFEVDLLASNIALFGAAMSGKTTFVRNIINVLHKQYNEKQEQIFVLDFGGALFEYSAWPLVSAYFDNSNEEYVKRVFKILDNILKSNINRLNGKNFKDRDVELIHTTFIIDNINSFLDELRYSAYHEKLAKLCREGISKGITVVFTATETKGVTRYLGSFKQIIAFELPVERYADIFNSKVSAISNNPGHGYANVTVRPEGVTGNFKMNFPYEVQCALPSKDIDNEQSDYYEKLHEKFDFAQGTYKKTVKKYYIFPKELTKTEYVRLLNLSGNIQTESSNLISVGLDYVDFNPVNVNLHKAHAIAIYGKKEFGKTNLLSRIINQVLGQEEDIRFVFFDDGRKQLTHIYEKVKETSEAVLIDQYKDIEICINGEEPTIKKLSPLQQFYLYLNEKYVSLDKRFMASIYGLSKELSREISKVPDCEPDIPRFTVFVIQSKQVYLNMTENQYFINHVLPQLVSVAEEYGFCFIFADVQKMSELEQNTCFNNSLSVAFLLDNIAEFATERGQRTIFGNMDTKSLKEDYARCELGDGYYYDIEADNLVKVKFIKE